MNGLSDFYQRLVGIKNLVTSKEHEPLAESAINGMLKFLEQVDVTVGKGQVKLRRAAQDDYLSSLKGRIDHLYGRVTTIYAHSLKAYVDKKLIFLPDDEHTINNLRDFYHYLYYTSFFIGRYVLIWNGDKDESQHAKLRARFKNITPVNESVSTMASMVIANIDSLSKKRDVADYIINLDRVREFATVETITQDLEHFKSLYDGCGKL